MHRAIEIPRRCDDQTILTATPTPPLALRRAVKLQRRIVGSEGAEPRLENADRGAIKITAMSGLKEATGQPSVRLARSTIRAIAPAILAPSSLAPSRPDR